jgi:hypothetical protein
MASTTASAGSDIKVKSSSASKLQISESIGRLSGWLEKNNYQGYDTFDGLNAKFARPLTLKPISFVPCSNKAFAVSRSTSAPSWVSPKATPTPRNGISS